MYVYVYIYIYMYIVCVYMYLYTHCVYIYTCICVSARAAGLLQATAGESCKENILGPIGLVWKYGLTATHQMLRTLYSTFNVVCYNDVTSNMS